jgi:hypothetical protein
MLRTPMPPSTPIDPFGAAFGKATASLTEEPASSASNGSPKSPHLAVPGARSPKHRGRSGEPRGIHMLNGIDERLKREKAAAERDEKIACEFDDAFVTQVYNYLSLGYPSLARAFDDELSKISRIPIEDLIKDDEETEARGHVLSMGTDGSPAEGESCVRWRALKIYIYEWARQHPDLDGMDPLAWGVRERRGSWAI